MRQDNQAALDAAFRLSLDLANVSEHQGWRTARDQVLAALAAGPGLVALVGPAGTGKTLLLRDLAHSLRAAGRETELVGRGDLHFDAGASDVVLVDEAARIDESALDSLATPGVAAVLADLPGLETRLERLGLAITVVRLGPLQPDEIGVFVADRLARAGQPTDLLTADAVEALARHSAGVPRVLNLLARAALFMAETEAAARVEERHVSLALALRDGETPEMDAPSSPPDVRAQCRPALPDDASFEEGESPQPSPASEPKVLRDAPSDDGPTPAIPDAGVPDLPALPTSPATLSRPRIRLVRQGVALFAVSILVIASVVAGWSHRPYLTNTVRAALALATTSPAPVPRPPEASSAGNQSP